MYSSEYNSLIFYGPEGKSTNSARTGSEITIYGRDLRGCPFPKVLFYGPSCHVYAQIISASNRRLVFKVPKMDTPGWHKVKVYTIMGWSQEHYLFCC